MVSSILSNNERGKQQHHHPKPQAQLDGEFEFTSFPLHKDVVETSSFAADSYLEKDFGSRNNDDLWPLSPPVSHTEPLSDDDDDDGDRPQFTIVQPPDDGDGDPNASENEDAAWPTFRIVHNKNGDYDVADDTPSFSRRPSFSSSVLNPSRTPSSFTSPSISREPSVSLTPQDYPDDEMEDYNEGRQDTPMSSYGSPGFEEQEEGMYVFSEELAKAAQKAAEVEDTIDLSSPVYSHYIPVGVLRRCASRYPLNTTDEALYYLEQSVRLLKHHGWIVTSVKPNPLYLAWEAVRIYVLPHDMDRGETVTPSNTKLRYHLRTVMGSLDVSPESWEGRYDPNTPPVRTPANRVSTEMEPLTHVFNTLKSPKPNTAVLPPTNEATRIGMERILEPFGRSRGRGHRYLAALKTQMYPYQRRSAAYMLQREVVPTHTFDPRLEPFVGPLGNEFYFDPLRARIVRQNTLVLQPHGGVLAEPSGYGKTLICLALILSTKGQLSRARIDEAPKSTESDLRQPRFAPTSKPSKKPKKSPNQQIPTKKAPKDGENNKEDEKNQASAPPKIGKRAKRFKEALERTKQLLDPRNPLPSAATLVVVPAIMLGAWVSEIEKHFVPDTFAVLVIAGFKDIVPPVEDLLRYDIVIITRERLDREEPRLASHTLTKPRSKITAAALKRTSSLSFIRWFRLIFDEAHHLSRCSGSGRAKSAVQELQVDRRWAVTSVPAPGLRNLYGDPRSLLAEGVDMQKSPRLKRAFVNEEFQTLAKLRHVVVDFVRLAPFWGEGDGGWFTRYFQLFAGPRTRKLHSLRETFQYLMVRHTMEELDCEVELPRLHQKTVHLEPTYYDKLTLNAFMFILVVNAITSRRRGEDYIFHPENHKSLSRMVDNMRNAGFSWTGIKPDDLLDTLALANDYLAANREMMEFSDIALLEQGIAIAKTTLRCMSWRALTFYDEVGMLLNDFPDHARDAWALDDGLNFDRQSGMTLLGITQASMAQMFATSCFDLEGFDPSVALSGEGIRIRAQMHDRAVMGLGVQIPSEDNDEPEAADAEGDIALSGWSSTVIWKKPVTEQVPLPAILRNTRILTESVPTPRQTKSLPPDSPLAHTKLVGTTSSKLTYLVDRVCALLDTTDERILIVYEPNHFAFWVGEALSLLGIEFAVYSGNSKSTRRHNVLKDIASPRSHARVVLFDLHQASFGLDMACMSRVFIVAPIWNRGMERLLVNKVHRLAQEREVFIETLVLRGSFEEKLLKRRDELKHIEMLVAEEDPLLDGVMGEMLEEEGFMSMDEEEEGEEALMQNSYDENDSNENDQGNNNDCDDQYNYDDDDDIEMKSIESFENPHIRRPAYLQHPHGFFDTHKLAVKRHQPAYDEDEEEEE